jgi:hypothetical protein
MSSVVHAAVPGAENPMSQLTENECPDLCDPDGHVAATHAGGNDG